MTNWVFLLIGGMAGTLARYLLTGFLQTSGQSFPYGTWVVNLSGCFLIGLLSESGSPLNSPTAQILLISGFCGAFTTFSTFMLEVSLLSKEDPLRSFIYLFASVFAGFVVLRLGSFLGKAF